MDSIRQDAGSTAGAKTADAAAALPLRLTGGHTAIVGLQWGDEGKGQIVDLLTRQFDIVARYNGGANAGHSVHIGDEKFALHLVPSGILNPQTLNVVGNGVVVDPEGILQEIEGLRRRGVEVGANLKISDRAHVVMPYHKVQDALFDSAVAAAFSSKPLGTTGRGIGPCYADKALRSTAVRIGDLGDLARLRAKLGHVVALKNAMLAAIAETCGAPFETFDVEAIYDACAEQARALAPFVCDTTELLHRAVAAGKKILFEGANAALLDVDHGTYPFVTSSSCSSLGIYPGTGLPGGTLTGTFGVVKLYTSRVGAGPFPTELNDQTGENLRQVGCEFGTTTGRPRRCGWLDIFAVGYCVRLSGVTALACTGLAVLNGLQRLKICTGYRYQRRKLETFPADAAVLDAVEPIYEELEGFDYPISTCRSYDQLPSPARRYLQFVEDYLGVPVRAVCVGKRRDQAIAKEQ